MRDPLMNRARPLLIGLIILVAATAVTDAAPWQWQPGSELEPVRFVAVDLYVDAGGQPLAAYQIEILDPTGHAQLVGIEGGRHDAYRRPPFFDPAALSTGRVVVAAFSTDRLLPRGKTCVATLHLRITGRGEPHLEPFVEVASSPSGVAIPVIVELEGVGS